MSYDLERLVIGELLLVTLIVLGMHARRTITQVLFQRRRRSNMYRASSVFPVVSGARGVSTKDAWEQFVNDEKLIAAYRVTPRELESLKNGSMLGGVSCKEDILFLLKTIRGTGRRG
jgi:hypothetical protein